MKQEHCMLIRKILKLWLHITLISCWQMLKNVVFPLVLSRDNEFFPRTISNLEVDPRKE